MPSKFRTLSNTLMYVVYGYTSQKLKQVHADSDAVDGYVIAKMSLAGQNSCGGLGPKHCSQGRGMEGSAKKRKGVCGNDNEDNTKTRDLTLKANVLRCHCWRVGGQVSGGGGR